ncbi:Phosphopantetheinyl transferase [Phaeobacter gallaeciensis]|uniref:Phosphopantetheinyl transferase n=1 Tax=Phaeobacter gallaeciensis TaxID=60890 RepID=A0AAC9Z987_9RHOB|nr:Phosphopantetheinyl transferase [Phaeobacter gallaeciensis DSM 26640]ATE93037.1 Phosphopantetheinyl transferase [Phaeobacter gallaeciensis]ATE97141.1 Phosphopantetheinyl transferase [Phaeobacter gallaeciensis]ATF01702.1 Phosphopantetheinyl transferase [Phaeobacter gallaeciensis]ATF06082.1 Phosphopantetheinyl transferase [Phaeobacter gallaeciensis]
MKRDVSTHRPGARRSAIRPGEVHLWQGALGRSDISDLDLSLLSHSEHLRLNDLSRPEARVLYAASHVALRRVLATYTGCPGAALIFKTVAGGKPALVDAGGLEFNLSHSDRMWLIAVTRCNPIGVDIEAVRQGRRSDAVARRYFAPEENEALAACSDGSRPAQFAQIWALKEAYVKARGQGLALPLTAFAVRFQAGQATLLRCENETPADWSMSGWTPAPGYRAALAVKSPIDQICHLDL